MAEVGSELHVVMLPWLAFGHMIPFHQLGTALAKQGVRVSYISTPKNIARLPKIDPALARVFHYISLPLPEVPGGGEATVDLEFDQIQYLKVAYDQLQHQVKLLVSRHSPDWIISDFAAYWVPQIAQECGVKSMFFSIFSATLMAFIGPPKYLMSKDLTSESWSRTPEWGHGIFPPTIAFSNHEAIQFHNDICSADASGVSAAYRICKLYQGCDAIGVRSCREFEGEYIDLCQTLLGKPVVPTGVLPVTKLDDKTEHDSELCTAIFKWLDQQTPKSVIYVAFGSETKLSKDEVCEIAYGLELAQFPFIWVLRRPSWESDDEPTLPPGFSHRTSGKGMVWFGWAPQVKILSHSSIGGSLFHCGVASIVESLQQGLNLVLLPCVTEQGLNARVLAHKGLGIEVDRREDGSYTREDIARALRRSMVGDEAERIQVKARQAAEIFGDVKLHQDHYIGKFVEFLGKK